MTKEKMELIKKAFDNEAEYQLEGFGDNYQSSIDRDQAVNDEDGKAYYNRYQLINVDDYSTIDVSRAEMEEFAKTW